MNIPRWLVVCACALASTMNAKLVDEVDPFLGTAPLTDPEIIGYDPPWRVWAGLTFPGASLPNAMVQLSPITEFGSGAGYEYEDDEIHAFAHTNKGHWNLCHIPMLPVTGEVDPRDFASRFSHEHEAAEPGYYRVRLERYGVGAELTTSLRGGFHRYDYPEGAERKLVVNLARSNERVRDWEIEAEGDRAFRGRQDTGEVVYFHVRANHDVTGIRMLEGRRGRRLPVVGFADSGEPLELRVGLSFVSAANARENLEAELAGRTFEEVREEASTTWESLLSKIRVRGGSGRERGLFYSCLYRSFLWPALRSDVNGEFRNRNGDVVKKDFRYYTDPALWDDFRNKLVLLGMLAPDVTNDVIGSMIDRGTHRGFMPTFFHGDHAAPFIAGSYLRGLRDYDVEKAYELLVRNATEESRRGRPHLDFYMEKGYIPTREVERPEVETEARAGVAKTLEYAYDDYAVALLARELGEEEASRRFMERSGNYRNVFDESTGLMRGRLENGDWVEPFDPQQPYYKYMYREANAWQATFFAPHDTAGLIGLYEDEAAFERQLDRLFTIPWDPDHIARNVASFIGQYCHGNQPDHNFPFLYHFVGRPEKSQVILDEIMDRFYGMEGGRTLCGMDDAGEMSSWYVFAAMGIYPYSPADPEYVVAVPLFDEVVLETGEDTEFAIRKPEAGRKLESIRVNGTSVDGHFIPHSVLAEGGEMTIRTSPAESRAPLD